ncbi:hypothetical protein BDV95DRAFT_136443 [Massariosphaeria phaeospora]|uniref:Uncharacterized protein n=1 Tax=Massariosphaeria phaeospora TaxID=100035 RepID=A0A7C8MU49_9PLEO|nr:hypothetical protein BDV95DRAFT_136443 [Massariosphaeria phaeospora]
MDGNLKSTSLLRMGMQRSMRTVTANPSDRHPPATLHVRRQHVGKPTGTGPRPCDTFDHPSWTRPHRVPRVVGKPRRTGQLKPTRGPGSPIARKPRGQRHPHATRPTAQTTHHQVRRAPTASQQPGRIALESPTVRQPAAQCRAWSTPQAQTQTARARRHPDAVAHRGTT